MEQVRYRVYAPSCPPDLEMVVTARRLSENRTMSYIRRSHLHPSWAPYPEKSIQREHQLARAGRKKRANEKSSKPLKLLWKDPEIKRRGRVATYKMYGAEGRVKRSLKKGYSWFKRKCLEIVRHI